MRSIRVEVRQKLDAALVQSGALKDGKPSVPEPYRVDVVALDESDNEVGGTQVFKGRSPVELIEKLSLAYGHLYEHLKVQTADIKMLRAQLKLIH